MKSLLKDFWNDWSWEWFCSMNLHDHSTINTAEHYLRKWRVGLERQEDIRVGYVGYMNLFPHPHIHLLMIGCNENGETLPDVEAERWEKFWYKITRQTAHIVLIDYSEGATGYIVDQNTPRGHSEMIEPYNTELLNEKRSG